MIDHDNDEPAIDTNLVDDPTVPDEPLPLIAGGGWCSPSDAIFPLLLPDVAVQRGGISFTTPKPLAQWKKKDLVREVEQLREDLTRARGRERELERKNRRLRRAIKRLIG